MKSAAMRRTAHALKTIARLCACGLLLFPAAAAEESSAGTELRVMAYNIHHGEGTDGRLDLERIARIVLEAKPDVVCIQEVDKGLSRTERKDFPAIFEELLSMKGVYGPNYFFDGGEYGNATFSRFPIVDHENHALPGPPGAEPRGTLRVTIDVNGTGVDIFNIHWGLWPDERAEQGRALLAHVRDMPTLIAGDFNEDEKGAGLAALLKRFRDTASAPAHGGYPGYPAFTPRRRIDFILASPGLASLRFAVLDGPEIAVASDHRPVMADVLMPGKPAEQNLAATPLRGPRRARGNCVSRARWLPGRP